VLFCPPISTPSPPKRCGRILHFFTFTLLPHQTLSLHNSTACSNSFWWHWHFRLRSQPAWTGSGKALANSSPHQPIPGDMTFHNTLSTCLVTVLCEASMITLQTVDDWLLSCSDASSDGVPYRFTKCDVSLRRCKIEQTKVFPNRFPSTKLCTNLDEPGILASL